MGKIGNKEEGKTTAIIIAGDQLGKFIFDDTIPKMIDSTVDHLKYLLGPLTHDDITLFKRTTMDSLCSYLNFPPRKEEEDG